MISSLGIRICLTAPQHKHQPKQKNLFGERKSVRKINDRSPSEPTLWIDPSDLHSAVTQFKFTSPRRDGTQRRYAARHFDLEGTREDTRFLGTCQDLVALPQRESPPQNAFSRERVVLTANRYFCRFTEPGHINVGDQLVASVHFEAPREDVPGSCKEQGVDSFLVQGGCRCRLHSITAERA